MICPACNNEIKDGNKFCTVCGAPLNQQQPYPQVNQGLAPAYQAPVFPTPMPVKKTAPLWLTILLAITTVIFMILSIVMIILYSKETSSSGSFYTSAVDAQYDKYVNNSQRATDISTAENIRQSILADIADQMPMFSEETTIPVSIDEYHLPTALSSAPTMVSPGYKGEYFKAVWDPRMGTCDVYDYTGTYCLTDADGVNAFRQAGN